MDPIGLRSDALFATAEEVASVASNSVSEPKVSDMDPIGLRITSIGRSVPSRIVTAAELDELLGVDVGWVLKKTGVAERRWVTDETLLELAVDACTDAFEGPNTDTNTNDDGHGDDVRLDDIDLIIYAGATPHQLLPDTAAFLQRELGLGASGVKSFSVHSTCLSFIAALDIAASHVASGRHRNVLIVSAEIPSFGIDVSEPESAALLGDMATAVVMTGSDVGGSQLRSLVFETYGDGADLCQIEGGGVNKHPSLPSTKPEDHLFHMNGPGIFAMAYRRLPGVLDRALAEAGVAKHDLDLVIPHQASLPAVKAIQRAFGVDEERVVLNLDRFGNCVSASLPGALYDAIADRRVRRGDTILLAGTGAGLSLAGAVLTW